MTTNLNVTQIRLFTAFFSLFLSIIAFYTSDLINSDGILYIHMAQAFLADGLEATAQLYNWPLFSILIAQLHALTGLSFELSAAVLNIALFVVVTDALVLISTKLLPNPFQIAIAAVFILCFIALNDYRGYVIRDIGYWATVFLAIYAMIRFSEQPSWFNAGFWQVTIFAAFFFRIEALLTLLLLPLLSFFYFPPRHAIVNILKLNSLVLLGLVIATIFSFSHNGLAAAFGKAASVTQYLDVSSFITNFEAKHEIVRSDILSKFAKSKDADIVLFYGLLALLALKLISGLSYSYAGIYLYAKAKIQPLYKRPARRIVFAFFLINLLTLFAFLFTSYFLSTRYGVALYVAALLLVLPAICQWLENLWLNKKRKLIYLVAAILFIGLIDSMTSSVTKTYIKDTAIWAAQNLPADAHVVTDDIFIDFYFNEHQPQAQLTLVKSLKNKQQADYIIVVQKSYNDTKAIMNSQKVTPLQEFENSRGDKAVILQTQHTAP